MTPFKQCRFYVIVISIPRYSRLLGHSSLWTSQPENQIMKKPRVSCHYETIVHSFIPLQCGMRVTFGYLWPDPENRNKISEFRDKTSIINRKKIETTNRRSVAKNSKDPRCVAKRTTRVYPAKVLHGFRYSFPRTYDDDTTFVHQIEFDCGFLDGSPGSSRSRGIKCRQRWHRARTIKRAFAKFGIGQPWIAYNFETSFKLSQASNASWIIWVLFTWFKISFQIFDFIFVNRIIRLQAI